MEYVKLPLFLCCCCECYTGNYKSICTLSAPLFYCLQIHTMLLSHGQISLPKSWCAFGRRVEHPVRLMHNVFVDLEQRCFQLAIQSQSIKGKIIKSIKYHHVDSKSNTHLSLGFQMYVPTALWQLKQQMSPRSFSARKRSLPIQSKYST